MYTIAVSGQDCTDTVTVGSLTHNINLFNADQTFILAGYRVPCSGTVVAWEFCYQISGPGTSVTFYPGIWRITGTMGNTDYTLVQSNTVTYDQSVRDPQDPNFVGCQIFNLSDTDQFTAPVGSFVGLYSNVITQLLHTNTNSSITTYRFSRNQSSVTIAGNSNDDVNYNIDIRAHLGKTIKRIRIFIILVYAHILSISPPFLCVYVCTLWCTMHGKFLRGKILTNRL